MRYLNVDLFDDDLKSHWFNCSGSIRTLDALREITPSRTASSEVASKFNDLFLRIELFNSMRYELILELMSAGQAIGNDQFIRAPDAMSALQILLDLIAYLAQYEVVQVSRTNSPRIKSAQKSEKSIHDAMRNVTPEEIGQNWGAVRKTIRAYLAKVDLEFYHSAILGQISRAQYTRGPSVPAGKKNRSNSLTTTHRSKTGRPRERDVVAMFALDMRKRNPNTYLTRKKIALAWNAANPLDAVDPEMIRKAEQYYRFGDTDR